MFYHYINRSTSRAFTGGFWGILRVCLIFLKKSEEVSFVLISWKRDIRDFSAEVKIWMLELKERSSREVFGMKGFDLALQEGCVW